MNSALNKRKTVWTRDSGMIEFRSRLLDVLRTLPFDALETCVQDLLTAEGYIDARLVGRTGYRGRNKEGGYDLEAFLPSPLDSGTRPGGGNFHRKVIVQVKQFAPSLRVYQRTLDELRGACLRTGAVEGVLITTSDFSSVVCRSEASAQRKLSDMVAPLHLLNGEALASTLIRHGIGVRKASNGGLALDRAYFNRFRDAETGRRIDTETHTESHPDTTGNLRTAGKGPASLPRSRARMAQVRGSVTLTLPLAFLKEAVSR